MQNGKNDRPPPLAYSPRPRPVTTEFGLAHKHQLSAAVRPSPQSPPPTARMRPASPRACCSPLRGSTPPPPLPAPAAAPPRRVRSHSGAPDPGRRTPPPAGMLPHSSHPRGAGGALLGTARTLQPPLPPMTRLCMARTRRRQGPALTRPHTARTQTRPPRPAPTPACTACSSPPTSCPAPVSCGCPGTPCTRSRPLPPRTARLGTARTQTGAER